MGDKRIRVLVVDDHSMVRKGIRSLLDECEDMRVIGEAANGLQAIEATERLKPDVILIDLLMPVMDGIEAIKRIIAKQPGQRIIVLTAYAGEDQLLASIKAGALGYIVKDAQVEELLQSIRNAYAGEPTISPEIAWKLLHKTIQPKGKEEELTQRENAILRMMALGETDHQIAEQLVVSEVTIRSHVSRIIKKIGARNRVEAIRYGFQSGLASISEAKSFGV